MLNFQIGNNDYGISVLQVRYPGCEVIEIGISDIFKDTAYNTLYDQINEYVVTLPDYVQREIYDVILKVSGDEYKNNYGDISVANRLKNNITKVAELLNYNNFKMWMTQMEGRMFIPDTVFDTYTHDQDLNTTKEKTYITREYCDLIKLVIFIRALSPIYLDFYTYIKEKTPHYYYRTFMLFDQSSIYFSPEIDKLKEYIDTNQQTLIGTSKHEHLIITAGLSDDDLLDSLVSETIFNKLIKIDFFDKKCNIVSFIFQTIKFKGKFTTSDSTAIRSKTKISDNSKEDISYFEDYRKTSKIPIGTAVEIQHSLSDIPKLIQSLGYHDFDFERYKRELQNLPLHMNQRLDRVQRYLLGWFMNRVINPRAFYYIEYIKVVELMLFTKVILIQHQQYFIASLLSSARIDDGSYINVILKNTLNKALVKKLTEYYGFVMEDDKTSEIEKTISEVSKEINNSLWKPVGCLEGIESTVNVEGYLEIPNNINDVVCSYVDFVNTTH